MKKKIAFIILLIFVICGIYYYYNRPTNLNELTLFGNVEIRQVDLSFQVGGKISQMYVEEGDSIKKGDLIASLDDKDYAANFKKAVAEVEKAAAASKNAQDIYDRKNPLCDDNTISQEECDAITNNKAESEASYSAAIANKIYVKNQWDYTKIFAPENGIITVRVQEPGATVQKGQPVCTLSKSKPIWIRAYVSEKDLGNIKYDMKAKVLTDAIDPKTGKKREYVGRIGYISPVAEFTPKTVQTEDLRTDLVYRIRVYVDDFDAFLRQGMPTTIKIDLKE
ncbi:MAG: efflux RND transporter periplasmic adaptor subunit [Candidatus Gastranaerophilales bacterium]|nr:efflux RND transporter periplasmic adaptor subunit [Candidatus Gastranaerophilales bacterium]